MPILSVRVDENLASKLREVAEDRGISISDFIREAIMHYLKLREEGEETHEVEIPTNLEDRLARIEAEIKAIWRRFDEFEEEKMLEHIFEGFEEFLEEQERESGESG